MFSRQALSAILWKCWKVRCRTPIRVALARCVPVLLYLLVAFHYGKVGKLQTEVGRTMGYRSTAEDLYSVLGNYHFYYAPYNGLTEKAMRAVQQDAQVPASALHGFSNKDDLLNNYERHIKLDDNFLIVIFNNLNGNDSSVPSHLDYTIQKKVYSYRVTNYYDNTIGPGSGLGIYEDFAALQLSINNYFLHQQKGLAFPVSISVEEFPYPEHINSQSSIEFYITFFPVFTMISFNFLAATVILDVVEEKRSGVKELMKMMGLDQSVMWLALFIESLLWALIPLISVVILIKVKFGEVAALPTSDPILLFLFITFYFCACTSFSFVWSTLTSKPAVAVIVSLCVFVASMGTAGSLFYTDVLGTQAKYLLSLLPNGALVYGYLMIHDFETRNGVGMQWSNLFQPSNSESGHDYMGVILLMLLGQTVVYMLLALYIDALCPGNYGIPKKWNFFLYPLRRFLHSKSFCLEGSSSEVTPLNSIRIELGPNCERNGIEIIDLNKIYGNTVALDNLNLKFPSGHINVLVGKNGAGKSTTMNILTGMTNYTKGSVKVLDLDLKTHLKRIRSICSICPQHDLYFERLTVYDHFIFIAKLNGIKNCEDKVNNLLQKLDLTAHKDKLPTTLSGGMKRKLCFGMALVSDPEILILDEPTSGLDPVSRRKLWDILLEWSRNDGDPKTVLLSTHVMEEAEALGDNIAVFGYGKVVAQGTLHHLREKYGSGCTLTVTLTEPIDSSRIDEIVEAVIKDSKKIVEKSTEWVLTYTVSSLEQSQFGNLLKKIESIDEVETATIKACTLDDIYMKISQTYTPGRNTEDVKVATKPNSCCSTKKLLWILINYQCKVFNWLFFAIGSVIVVGSIGFGFYLGNPLKIAGNGEDSSFLMDFSVYGPTTVFYSGNESNPVVAELMNKYKRLIINKGGTPQHVPSVQEALLEIGRKNILDYPKHSIAGAEFEETSNKEVGINILYSEKAIHAAPIAINLVYNMLLNQTQLDGIVTTADSLKSLSNVPALQNLVVAAIVPILTIALLVVICFTTEIPFYNRINGMKHIQSMNGISPTVYWSSLFLFHYLIYLIITLGICIVYVLAMWLQHPILHMGNELVAFVLILLQFGVAGILFAFCASHLGSLSSICNFVFGTNLAAIVIGSVMVYTLQNVYNHNEIGQGLAIILNIFPGYWFVKATVQLFSTATSNFQWSSMDELTREQFCRTNSHPCCSVNGLVDAQECSDHQSYFSADVLLPFLVPLASSLVILFLMDKRVQVSIKQMIKKPTFDSLSDPKSYLDVLNVTKKFSNNQGVKDVSFKVNSKECTGILGPNGAGKSTTMEILAGRIAFLNGNAAADKKCIHQDYFEYLQKIGYCSQQNMFNGRLTGRQVLEHMAKLRNIPNEQLNDNVENCIKLIGLDEEMANRRCSKYSGGNKRKLSIGMAIIGLPRVIIMDEPTTGVDPTSRQLLWNTITKVKRQASAILLSSHIMEECENLCDKIYLMQQPAKENSSSIVCEGTVPYVKSNLGKGVTVEIRYNDPGKNASVELKDGIMSRFGSCHLLDEHLSQMRFYLSLTSSDKRFSSIYCAMEEIKNQYSTIDSYLINTPTLEDIILNLAKEQP